MQSLERLEHSRKRHYYLQRDKKIHSIPLPNMLFLVVGVVVVEAVVVEVVELQHKCSSYRLQQFRSLQVFQPVGFGYKLYYLKMMSQLIEMILLHMINQKK